MKGYRFYLEFANTYKRCKNKHCGNVVAVLLDACGKPLVGSTGLLDSVVGAYDRPNSGVTASGAQREYLATRCKRISEALARSVHPALFAPLCVQDVISASCEVCVSAESEEG